MNLSENFTSQELTKTETGLLNNPDWYASQKLFYLANYILQPIRDKWGPYITNSAFRSREVNDAVGGEKDSQHLFGEAHDGRPKDAPIDTVFDWICGESQIFFGQCILENLSWIHISLPRIGKKNKEALIYENGIFKPYI